MPKISVFTPTIRTQYLHITQTCLSRQTFKDFEWLVEVDISNDFLLPKALNRMLKRANGEIIVMLQDCITIPDNFLEHVVNTYSGQFVTYPMRKGNEWDWRKSSYGEIQPQEWEADIAVAPRKAFFDIGGYDEKYCEGWSWENVDVAYRAKAAGYKFMCDNTIETTAIDHDKEVENPFRNKKKNNDSLARETYNLAEQGKYKLNYLDSFKKTPLSELIDRASIVSLKKERLGDAIFTLELEDLLNAINVYKREESGGWIEEIKTINGKIWDLESDLRKGKDGELGLEEIGRRAILIRDLNKERIECKNKVARIMGEFLEIKGNHASQ